jgi:glutamate dehydrogenase
MQRHRLRREIIAANLSNAIIDIAGPTFPIRLREATGCDARGLVIAFEAAWRIFRLEQTWGAVTALDAGPAAAAQLMLYQETSLALRRQTYWLARRMDIGEAQVQTLVEAYRPAADALRAAGVGLLSPLERQAAENRAHGFMDAGAPEALALEIAALRALTATTDVADLALAAGWEVLTAGQLYHQAGAAFGFDRLRAAAGSLLAGDAYERQAVRQVIEDFLSEQAAVTRSIMASAEAVPDDAAAGRKAIAAWAQPRRAAVEAAARLVADIEGLGEPWSFAKLSIANGAMRQLSATAQATV